MVEFFDTKIYKFMFYLYIINIFNLMSILLLDKCKLV